MQSYRNSTTLLSTVALLIISYSFFISYQLQQISFSLPLFFTSPDLHGCFLDLPPAAIHHCCCHLCWWPLFYFYLFFLFFWFSFFFLFLYTRSLSCSTLLFLTFFSLWPNLLSLSFSLILHDQYFPTEKKKKINWNQLKINGHFKITTWSMLFSDRKRPAYKGQFHKLEFHYHIKPATQITWICIYKF